jgi:peptide/nickel transport system permease protein
MSAIVSPTPDLLPARRPNPFRSAVVAIRDLRRRSTIPPQLAAGCTLAFLLLGTALVTWRIPSINPNTQDLGNTLKGLFAPGHILGTDNLGHDLLAQDLAGLRWTGSVAGTAALLVSVIGVTIGVTAASVSGLARVVIIRIVDVALSIPGLIIAIAILAIVGRGFIPLTITLAIVSWPIFSRVVYAEARGLMQREYMLASKLLGISRVKILFAHLIPGLRNTIMVMFAFAFADLLVAEAALSFLGIGAPLGAPSLGNMLSEGQEYLTQLPSLSLVPGITIILCVTAANLIGDGIAARSRAVETAVRG